MTDSPTEISAIMLLCDSAESVNGKLYILGGGWSRLQLPPDSPARMALAIKIAIPWDRANDRIPFVVSLRSKDGDLIEDKGEAVQMGGEFEVGRPPGLDKGTPLDAMIAIAGTQIEISPGGYVWVLEVDGKVCARTPFSVIQ